MSTKENSIKIKELFVSYSLGMRGLFIQRSVTLANELFPLNTLPGVVFVCLVFSLFSCTCMIN